MKIKLSYSETVQIVEYFRTRHPQFLREKTNKRAVVYCKVAIANALVKHTTYENIASALDMDRSTMYHYVRQHEALSIYRDYKDLYEDAVFCATKMMAQEYLNAEDASFDDLEALREEVSMLRQKIAKLRAFMESQINILQD